jgi:hypothetical protein
MKPNWTKIQTDMFANPELSDKDIAQLTGKTEPAVRGKRQRINAAGSVFTPAPKVKPPSTYAEDRKRVAGEHLKREHKALQEKYEKLLKERNVAEMVVEAVREAAPLSYETAPVITRRPKGKGQPQALLVMLSDCHAGAVVTPEQTGGEGKYDFPTFLARLKFYEDAIVSILQDHVTTEVPEIVLVINGDILDGQLNHGAEAGQHNTVFSQFYGAGHAIAQFIRNIACHAPKMRIYNTVGNHPRWSNQHKMPTTNRFSNMDLVLSAFLEALTKDILNVQWFLDQQPFARFQVFDFVFQALHGDQLRGGDKAMGIPSHSAARLISATTSLCESRGTVAPHYFLVGHLHRSIVLPTTKGSFIVGGGFVGLDGFGLAMNFTPVPPSQTMLFVHPHYGQTATYQISLKDAVVTDEPPYTIPGNFPVE